MLIRCMANLAERIRGTPLDALIAAKKGDQLAANPLIAVLAAQPINTVAQQKQALASFLSHWLDESQVTIALDWSGGVIDFCLAPSHPLGIGGCPGGSKPRPIEIRALGAISAELLWAVMQREGLARCSACSSWYDPRAPRKGRKGPGRWPRPCQNHFCQVCGPKAKNRFAQRKYRAKKKGEIQ